MKWIAHCNGRELQFDTKKQAEAFLELTQQMEKMRQ